MAAVTICCDLEAPKIKCHRLHCFPIYCHEVMGPDAMILVFWMLSFKPTFSLSSFTFIKRLFSSSLLSAIRVVSSAYLKLLTFLLAILIPACACSTPAFLMMYYAYKLNKQGDNIQPWHTSFPIWNQSVVPCPVLTVSSWPAYRFLKRQVRSSGIPISSVHCDPNSRRLWHSQQSRNSCFSKTLLLYWWWMLAIWSLVPLSFLKPAWISGSSWFIYFWRLVWRILSITLSVCEMSEIVQYFEHSLALPFLGMGMKTDLF